MRRIQQNTIRFKKWTALTTSSIAFLVLWLVGAVVFMLAEKDTQGLSYFQAMYFCYVSLLTIGYGDLSPRSNAGKAFFLLWSIWSVPTITVLISSMGGTIISSFQDATLKLADYTVIPKDDIRKSLNHMYRSWKRRFSRNPPPPSRRGSEVSAPTRRLTNLNNINEHPLEGHFAHENAEKLSMEMHNDKLPQDFKFHELLTALTRSIRRVAKHMEYTPKRAYEYEEWVEFTRLIRACEYSKPSRVKGIRPGETVSIYENIDNDEGFVLWDWIGEDSPLLNEGREPAWVHDRLTKGLEELSKTRWEHHDQDGQSDHSAFLSP